MKRICFVLVLLLLILPGCGRKPTLDQKTADLIETSDAVCLVTVAKGEAHAYGDGTCAWLMKCRVRADYLGNLSERGTDLNGQDRRYLYVLLEEGWYSPGGEQDWPGEGTRLLLFLNRMEKNGYWRSGYLEYYPFFAPNGAAGLRREPTDAEGIRLLKALRAYGKQNPRATLEEGAYDGIGELGENWCGN